MAMEQLLDRIPKHLAQMSGGVFYSGRNAFVPARPLYLLGLNPGGCPEKLAANTVELQANAVAASSCADWSEYRDVSWNGAEPGTHGMATRVLHLFNSLRLNPGEVPASNLVFLRSRRESGIEAARMRALADDCWSFHECALNIVRPRAILCFGQTVGTYVRSRLNANELIDEFVEDNKRRWRSQAFATGSGVRVVVATHPSIADWTASATDVSKLVASAIA